MDKRARAIAYVRANEGGFSDHPDDPGGATNHGISLRHARAVGDIDGDGFAEFDLDRDGRVTAEDIRAMPMSTAIGYYELLYDKWRIGEIEEPAIAIKIFDLCFPMGFGGASRVVQRALRACGNPVLEDGVMGSKTIAAINGMGQPAYLMIALNCEAAGYFRCLKSKSFEAGWLTRAYRLPFQEKIYD
ncbi:glycoside hydrolase family 108 protein [Sneathiella sp.]|uniref:glycoside hydrolase family 108 protein n=1 Tax=Sneathiella sp. TaxID=1964365 RepID=UPI002FE2DFD3